MKSNSYQFPRIIACLLEYMEMTDSCFLFLLLPLDHDRNSDSGTSALPRCCGDKRKSSRTRRETMLLLLLLRSSYPQKEKYFSRKADVSHPVTNSLKSGGENVKEKTKRRWSRQSMRNTTLRKISRSDLAMIRARKKGIRQDWLRPVDWDKVTLTHFSVASLCYFGEEGKT